MGKRTRISYLSLSFALIATFASMGCIFSKQSGAGTLEPGFSMPPRSTLLLSQVPDGSGADGVMPGSGELVRSGLGGELLKRGFQVFNSEATQQQQLLDEAKSKGATFALLARITIWEENATSWSGKRDQAGISIQLYDVATGALKGSSERTAHGVRHPNQCAPWLTQTAVAAMFGEAVDDEAAPPC